MTKAELISRLAEKTSASKKDVDRVLSALAEIIVDETKAGQSVPLTGLGTFSLAERSARPGRNPKTGEPITIQASKSIKFKPGKAIKDALN